MSEETIERITIKTLSSFTSVYSAIEYARSTYPSYPPKPVKPKLEANATPIQIREYADLVEQYNTNAEHHKLAMVKYRAEVQEIESVMEAYIKHEAGLSLIPEAFRQKVWDKAWEDGHSSGYFAIYQQLKGLVELFV